MSDYEGILGANFTKLGTVGSSLEKVQPPAYHPPVTIPPAAPSPKPDYEWLGIFQHDIAGYVTHHYPRAFRADELEQAFKKRYPEKERKQYAQALIRCTDIKQIKRASEGSYCGLYPRDSISAALRDHATRPRLPAPERNHEPVKPDAERPIEESPVEVRLSRLESRGRKIVAKMLACVKEFEDYLEKTEEREEALAKREETLAAFKRTIKEL